MKRNCTSCGGWMDRNQGPLLLSDARLGMIAIPQATYWKCKSCGKMLYPIATARLIEEQSNRRRDEIVRLYPIGEFLNATDTAAVLGISRQALHKHRRISNGFIYQTTLSGKIVYLKQSVDLFKRTGDGRFSLAESAPRVIRYVSHSSLDQSSLAQAFASWSSQSTSTNTEVAYTTRPQLRHSRKAIQI